MGGAINSGAGLIVPTHHLGVNMGLDTEGLDIPAIIDKLELQYTDDEQVIRDNYSKCITFGYSHKQTRHIVSWVAEQDPPSIDLDVRDADKPEGLKDKKVNKDEPAIKKGEFWDEKKEDLPKDETKQEAPKGKPGSILK